MKGIFTSLIAIVICLGNPLFSMDDIENRIERDLDSWQLASANSARKVSVHTLADQNRMSEIVDAFRVNPTILRTLDVNGQLPIHRAALYGHTNLILWILRQEPYQITAPDSHGRTPLHLAADQGNPETITMLIAAKADLNAQDKYGQTPLHRAAQECFPLAARVLIEGNVNPNIQDNDGQTPLHLAVLRKDVLMIKELIKARLNFSLKNKYGHTAELIARMRYDSELAQIIHDAERAQNNELYGQVLPTNNQATTQHLPTAPYNPFRAQEAVVEDKLDPANEATESANSVPSIDDESSKGSSAMANKQLEKKYKRSLYPKKSTEPSKKKGLIPLKKIELNGNKDSKVVLKALPLEMIRTIQRPDFACQPIPSGLTLDILFDKSSPFNLRRLSCHLSAGAILMLLTVLYTLNLKVRT